MISGYLPFVAYFRKLAWQHNRLRGSFFVGDSWTIISAQRTGMQYPALWLERPVFRPLLAPDGDSLRLAVEGAFSIVGGAAVDDYDKQEAILQTAQQIAAEIINRMKQDSDNDEFDLLIDNTRLDPLAVLMADDAHGWRVEFRMEVKGWDDCVQPSAWTLLDGTGAENLPLEPEYQPYVTPTEPEFECNTVADFAVHYDPARGLRLTDCTTYQPLDRRRDVYYTLTDGASTVLVAEFDRLLSDAEIASLNPDAEWTITQTVKTQRGCMATRTYPFNLSRWGGGGYAPETELWQLENGTGYWLLEDGSGRWKLE